MLVFSFKFLVFSFLLSGLLKNLKQYTKNKKVKTKGWVVGSGGSCFGVVVLVLVLGCWARLGGEYCGVRSFDFVKIAVFVVFSPIFVFGFNCLVFSC